MSDRSSPDIYDRETILATSPECESDNDVLFVQVDDCEIPISVVRFIEPIYDSPASPNENEDLSMVHELMSIENVPEHPSTSGESNDCSLNSNEILLQKPSLVPFRSITIDAYEKLTRTESSSSVKSAPPSATTPKKRGRPRKNKVPTAKLPSPPKKGRPSKNSTVDPPQHTQTGGDYQAPIKPQSYGDPEITNLQRLLQQIEELGRVSKLQVFEGIEKIVYDSVARINGKIEARKLALKAKGVKPTLQGCPRCGVSDENNCLRAGLRCRVCL
ncbi:hypothetical protein QAD02_002444 [Eretmocerus hayati]|uniref:Uncharacterized protein n=1 Tax=Eretmocerus hayati TaxID=131215 RepID=A0ACC2NIX0_9HYME|nr:hypothetical protein QAD02_002444 [Eretmocerus hayati]